jgi:hypothetical protein
MRNLKQKLLMKKNLIARTNNSLKLNFPLKIFLLLTFHFLKVNSMYSQNIVNDKNLPDTALLPNGKIPLFCYDSNKLYRILETFEDIRYYNFVDINKNFDLKKISENIPEKKIYLREHILSLMKRPVHYLYLLI